MARNLIRSLGFDLIKYPSRALNEAVLKVHRLEREIEQAHADYSKEIARLNESLKDNARSSIPYDYDEDGLRVWAKNVEFLTDKKFEESYQIGMQSGHKIGRDKGSDLDIGIRWRVYTICWAVNYAKKLTGDFVVSGVVKARKYGEVA